MQFINLQTFLETCVSIYTTLINLESVFLSLYLSVHVDFIAYPWLWSRARKLIRNQVIIIIIIIIIILKQANKQTPWPEFASELYRPSDRRLSRKLKRYRVISVTDPYGRNLGFLHRSSFLSSSFSVVLTWLSGPRSIPSTSQKTW
jgi:hypothetical protein